jgi:hypothetical protein
MINMRAFGAMALSLTLASASVQAASMVAQVGDFHGKVLVNQGEGFVPVSGPLALKAGDTVMIGEESFATVSYNECAVSLTEPTVFTVGEKAPCAKGEKIASVQGTFISPATHSYAGAGGVSFADPDVWLPLAAVGAAAATVLVVVLVTNKKGGSCTIPAGATSC